VDKLFRDILTRADTFGEAFFTADEVANWRKGVFKQFLALEMLKETAPAETVKCLECEEGCWIEPEIRDGPRKGQAVGTYFCRRNDDIGLVKVDLGRKRRWEFDLKGLARMVAKAAGATGSPVETEPGRLAMLGTAKVDGKTREVFLARGAAWQDAAQVFGNCSRLKMASHAVVLTLAATPKEPLLAGCELAVRPLAEIADFQKGKLTVSLDGAFPQAKPGPWAGIPNEPITLDQFMVRYCEVRTKNLRRSRRKALHGAARNETVKMPPLAGPYESGQSKKYFVRDLLKSWHDFLDENLDLPPLLSQYKTSSPQALSPTAVQ